MIYLYIGSILTSLLTAFGQIFFKKASISKKSFRQKLFDKYFISGTVLFTSAVVISIVILRRMDFSIFYSLTALNYVFITLFSALILKEKVDKYKIIGIVIITLGVLIFNFST